MYTATLIRRHINQLKGNKPFSIRDFLNYGSRNAVDQVFYRLVKSGQIMRIARGLFTKDVYPSPSISEVALAKAIAFGKSIAIHGSQAANQLKLFPAEELASEATYACNGASSSFRFGQIHVSFIGSSHRKVSLGDDLAGLVARALWHIGKTNCCPQLVFDAIISFNRDDRRALRQRLKTLPAWLATYFTPKFSEQNARKHLNPEMFSSLFLRL